MTTLSTLRSSTLSLAFSFALIGGLSAVYINNAQKQIRMLSYEQSRIREELRDIYHDLRAVEDRTNRQ